MAILKTLNAGFSIVAVANFSISIQNHGSHGRL